MKNKLLIILILFIAALLLVFGFSSKSKADVTGPAITLSAKNLRDNGHAYAGSDSKIDIVITINPDIELTSETVIYYRTVDKTAFSKAGEYVADEGSVTFYPNNEAHVYITVKQSKFATGTTETDPITNCFTFQITEIKGQFTIEDLDKTSIDCDCNYKDFFVCDYSKDNPIFNVYNTVITKKHKHKTTDAFHTVYHSWETFDLDTSAFERVKELGIASEYYGQRLLKYHETSSCSADLLLRSYYRVKGSDKNVLIQEIDVDGDISNGREMTWSEIINKNGSVDDTKCNTTWQKIGDMYLCKLPTDVSTIRVIELDNSDSWLADRDCTVEIYDTLYDYKAPTISSSYATTYDTYEDGVKVQKLRVSVRFSEPVSVVSGGTPSLECGLGYGATSFFEVSYVGGSGTDTLYFETDMTKVSEKVTENKNYTTVLINKVNNPSKIVDFSIDHNPFAAITSAVYAEGTNIDLRKPSTTVTPDKTITKSKIINLNVDLCRGGVVYYKWLIKGEHLPDTATKADYDGSVSFSSTGTTVVQIPRFEADGEYFLYVYVDSINGKYEKEVFGRSEITTDELQENGFLFDSTAPTVESSLKRTHLGVDANGNKVSTEFVNDEEVKIIVSDQSDAQLLNATYKYTLSDDGSIALSNKIGSGSYSFSLSYVDKEVLVLVDGSEEKMPLTPNHFENDGLKEKVLSFNINDYSPNGVSSGLSKITLECKNIRTREVKTIILYDVNNLSSGSTYTGKGTGVVTKIINDGLFCDANTTSKIPAIAFGIGDDEYGDFVCDCYITDGALNTEIVKINDGKGIRVDTRNRLESFVFSSSIEDEGFNLIQKVYNIKDGLELYFDANVENQPSSNGLHIYSLTIDNTTYKFTDENGIYSTEIESDVLKNVADYIKFEYQTSGGTQPTKIVGTANKSCFMSISFVYDGTQKTDIYDFYLTNDYNDETENFISYENTNLLKNKVYFINSENPFYYLDNVSYSIKKQRYNDTILNIAFSSKATAYNYFKFFELQDMSILYISDDDLANKLNFASDNRYLKDDSCAGVKAKRGDYWIKYKSSSWDLNQANNPTYWRYYYYGSDEDYAQLDQYLIEGCKTLNAALNAVCSYLTSLGFDNSYLVGDDYTLNGVPHLNEAQIIDESIYASVAKNGDTFKEQISFGADTTIYASYTTKNVKGVSQNIKMVPAWVINRDVHANILYYPYDGINEPNAKDFFEFEPLNGIFQKNLPADIGSSLYIVYEFNDYGAHKYLIFVDNETPTLNVKATINDKIVNDVYDSSSSGTTVGARNFSLELLSDDADEFAYAALYRKTSLGRSYIGTYRVSDIKDGKVALESNNYSLVVGDRSGNIFEISLYVNTDSMIVEGLSEKEVEANKEYLQIKCNRTSDQIKRFEVYLGNKRILNTNDYKQLIRLYETGYYTVIIEDVYNTQLRFENVYFERILPEINIKYKNENGDFVVYNEKDDDSPIKVNPIGNATYNINTSVNIQFFFEQKLSYEVLSGEFSGRTFTALGVNYISVDSLDDWSIRIFYTDYPTIGVTYTCLVDEVPPSIDVSYDKQSFVPMYSSELNTLALSLKENDKILIPSSIKFIEEMDAEGNIITNEIAVYEGGKIGVEKFSFTSNDANGLKSVEFFKMDKEGKYVLIKELSYENTERNIENNTFSLTVEEKGMFLIVSTDLYGNKSSISFENEGVSYSERSVDGKIDESSEIVYGNTEDTVKISTSGILEYLITTNGNKYFFMFYVSGEGLYKAHYASDLNFDEAGNVLNNKKINYKEVLDDSFFNPAEKHEKNKWYPVPDTEIGIEYMYDGVAYYFRVLSSNKSMTIETSLNLAKNTVYHYYVSKISNEVTDIKIVDLTTGNELTTNHDNNLILIHNEFGMLLNIVPEEVERIRIAFSKSMSFTNYSTVYKKGTEAQEYSTQRDGFYSIKILNVYGNTLEYIISKQNSLTVTIESVYKDGKSVKYSTSYNPTVYSNYLVKYGIISETARIVITKNNRDFLVVEPDGEEIRYVELTIPGKYEIEISDAYGSVIHRTCEIKSADITFNENLLYDYNELALGKDEGYTNKKLSIDYYEMMNSGIAYLAVEFHGKLYVLHDTLSEETIIVNGNDLLGALGYGGNGDYTVITRDKYGNCASKVIHYSETPTFSVYKNLRSDIEYVEILPDQYSVEGVWSNNSIKIETTSTNCIFRIDGSDAICPVQFNFTSDIGYGSFVYDIYYLDEYGFEYEFKCYLLRETININIPDDIETENIEGIITTKKEFRLTFSEILEAVYFIDDDKTEYVYQNGSTLYKDGVYRFRVYDKAGNSQILSLCKDSACYFNFIEQRTGMSLISGQVVNSNRVLFSNQGDNSYLYKVYRNGELVKEALNDVFVEDGRYDCIVKDSIGNVGYFMFYMFTKGISGIDYKVPYNYQITSIWLEKTTGEKYSVLDLVDVENGFQISKDSIINDDGVYEIAMKSTITSKTLVFKLIIDNTPPVVELVGCKDGETTLNKVTLKNYAVGDKIEIYKNEKLLRTINVTAATDAPTIEDGGNYKIVVTNAAGVSTILSFTKTHVANTAGSVLILILIILIIVALFIGLLLRNRSRVDK